MSRKIAGRLVFSGHLKVETPLHVGGLGSAGESDLPLAVNGAGTYYIPGTSLAGALRAWCDRALEKDRAICAIWGAGPQDSATDSGYASWITIDDALVGEKDAKTPGPVEIRDGIGINRVTGTAANTIKLERMVLPRGTRISLNMTVDVPKGDNATFGMAQALAELAAMIKALADQRIRFGAAKTRGLGRVSLCEDWCLAQYDLTKPGSLLGFLQKSPSHKWAGAALFELVQDPEEKRLTLTLEWKPTAPVMVKSGAEAVSIDMVPLVTGNLDSGNVHFVLPGSSLKGALRSQAERILNTLCPPESSDEPSEPENDKKPSKNKLFLRQIAKQPLAEALFGAPGKRAKKKTDTEKLSGHDSIGNWQPGLGALSIDDCFATSAVSQAQWDRILTAVDPDKGNEDQENTNRPQDGELKDQKTSFDMNNEQNRYEEYRNKFPNKEQGLKLKPTYHVAVDRWTGGAADGFLYQVLEPHDVAWEPICIALDFERLPEHCRAPALALVLLLVRDMAQGWLPIGFGVNRGHGSFEITNATLKGWAPISPHAVDVSDGVQAETLGGLPDGWADRLTGDWKTFIAKGGRCDADPS